MGGFWSSVKSDTKDTISTAVIRSKLIDIKGAKTRRDTELALKIATVRERCHWLAGFYVSLIIFNAGRQRVYRIKTFEPLPISWLPFVGTPFLYAYQVDFAYGTKLERLNHEAQHILKNESHWFNNGVRLPRAFEKAYREIQEEARKNGEVGEEWAVFSDEITKEELQHLTLPMTQMILPSGLFSAMTPKAKQV